jgi:hypothetical protein
MEWAMPKKTVLDSRIGDLFWYWVMAVRHHAAPARDFALRACQA